MSTYRYPVNYYYSDALTSDSEGNLVQLCDNCHNDNRDKVDGWAQAGDYEGACELCDMTNATEPPEYFPPEEWNCPVCDAFISAPQSDGHWTYQSCPCGWETQYDKDGKTPYDEPYLSEYSQGTFMAMVEDWQNPIYN